MKSFFVHDRQTTLNRLFQIAENFYPSRIVVESQSSEDSDPYLYLLEENQKEHGQPFRDPYNTRQERPQFGSEVTPQFIQGQRDSLEGFLREHELAQPVVINTTALLLPSGLRFSFGQKTQGSFLEESFASTNPQSKYVKLREYLTKRHGFYPTAQQLLDASADPDSFKQLLSYEAMAQTPLGLEFAEDLSLVRLQQILRNMDDSDIAVIFSPQDPKNRPTPYLHNWIRIYEKETTDEGGILIHITQIKTTDLASTFRKIYELFVPRSYKHNSPAYVVSQPIVFAGSKDEFLEQIGKTINEEYLATFDDVLYHPDVQELIEENLAMLNDLSIPDEVIVQHRKALGEYVIILHKYYMALLKGRLPVDIDLWRDIEVQEMLYGAGSGCGLDMAELQARTGAEFGNPSLPDLYICKHCGARHHIRNGDSSTYVSKCESCGTAVERCG